MRNAWTARDIARAQERLARLASEEARGREHCECPRPLPDRTYLGHRQCRLCEQVVGGEVAKSRRDVLYHRGFRRFSRVRAWGFDRVPGELAHA